MSAYVSPVLHLFLCWTCVDRIGITSDPIAMRYVLKLSNTPSTYELMAIQYPVYDPRTSTRKSRLASSTMSRRGTKRNSRPQAAAPPSGVAILPCICAGSCLSVCTIVQAPRGLSLMISRYVVAWPGVVLGMHHRGEYSWSKCRSATQLLCAARQSG